MSVKFISPKKSVNSATFEFPAVKNHLLIFGIEKLEQTGAKYIVDGEEIKGLPLLAIFNSNHVKLWIWYNCPELMGGSREIRKAYFENLRIPLNNADLLQQLATLADEIIATKSSLSLPKGTDNVIASESEAIQRNIATLETQVNTLVYQLYGITDAEEMEAVEKR